MPMQTGLYTRLYPAALVAEIVAEKITEPRKVEQHREASESLQRKINVLLEPIMQGSIADSRELRMYLGVREEMRSEWLKLVGGTREAASQVVQRLRYPCDLDTIPDGAICHFCENNISLEETDDQVVWSGFSAHKQCMSHYIVDILPTSYQENCTLCPCGCGTDLFTDTNAQ